MCVRLLKETPHGAVSFHPTLVLAGLSLTTGRRDPAGRDRKRPPGCGGRLPLKLRTRLRREAARPAGPASVSLAERYLPSSFLVLQFSFCSEIFSFWASSFSL